MATNEGTRLVYGLEAGELRTSEQAQGGFAMATIANVRACIRTQRLGIVDSVQTKEVTYVATGPPT